MTTSESHCFQRSQIPPNDISNSSAYHIYPDQRTGQASLKGTINKSINRPIAQDKSPLNSSQSITKPKHEKKSPQQNPSMKRVFSTTQAPAFSPQIKPFSKPCSWIPLYQNQESCVREIRYVVIRKFACWLQFSEKVEWDRDWEAKKRNDQT